EHVKASSYLDVLVRLASHVEGPDRDRVLAVAFDAFRKGASMSGGMMSGNIVEETLALFAQLAPPDWRIEILNAALNNIFQVPRGADWGARGFVHLIPQLPADIVDRGARVLLSDAAREAVENVTTSISGETTGSQTIVAEVIETLAEFLSDEVRAEAVELAKQIHDRGWRMGALLSLAPGLPEPQRTEIINEAIVTQESLDLTGADPEANYWRPLLALANLIEDAELKSQMLSRALIAARALDRSWRARALIEIGKKLEPDERAKVMMEVIPLNHDFYAHEMAPAFPPDKARELLSSSILGSVRHYEWSRGEAATAFIDTQSREAQYDLWMEAHTILNEHPRATLAS
ncbi:MAG TPA: hypothetical protein VFT26_06170, partial [Pyrinomonadaceae bacterium]|nr:hypothetical protein [Pyrinomonadaceae bacterium]